MKNKNALSLLGSVVLILIGLYVVIHPGSSLNMVVKIVGIALIIYGAIGVVGYLTGKSEKNTVNFIVAILIVLLPDCYRYPFDRSRRQRHPLCDSYERQSCSLGSCHHHPDLRPDHSAEPLWNRRDPCHRLWHRPDLQRNHQPDRSTQEIIHIMYKKSPGSY